MQKKKDKKYPIPERVNVTLSLVLLCLLPALLFIGGRSAALDAVFLVACLLFGVLLIPAYSLIHEAEHHMAMRNKNLNYYMGVSLSTLFFSSFTFIQKAHLNHHKNNRTDYELIDLYYTYDERWFKRISFFLINMGFKWISVVIAVFAFALLPRRVMRVLLKNTGELSELVSGTDPSSTRYRNIRIESLLTLCFHAGLVLLLDLNIGHYVLMYLFHGFVWSSQNYVSHAFASRSVVHGAHNYRLSRPFQLFYLNFNLHRAHHENPSVPWPYLDKFVGTPDNVSYLKAYLRLWKGPKHVLPDDAVEYRHVTK